MLVARTLEEKGAGIDHIEATLGLALFRARNRRPMREESEVGALLILRRRCTPEVRAVIAGGGTAAGTTFRRQFFVKSPDPEECRKAAVWRSPEACIGSMSVGNFWVQQRAILGYWRSGDEAAGLVLAAGGWEVTVRPAFALLSGHSVKWTCLEEAGRAQVYALVDDGHPLELEPAKIAEAALGFYLVLHPAGHAPAVTEVRGEKAGRDIRLLAETADGKLAVSSPFKPIPPAWFRG